MKTLAEDIREAQKKAKEHPETKAPTLKAQLEAQLGPVTGGLQGVARAEGLPAWYHRMTPRLVAHMLVYATATPGMKSLIGWPKESQDALRRMSEAVVAKDPARVDQLTRSLMFLMGRNPNTLGGEGQMAVCGASIVAWLTLYELLTTLEQKQADSGTTK